MCETCRTESTLDTLLDDPIVRLVMARDRVREDDIRKLVMRMRRSRRPLDGAAACA